MDNGGQEAEPELGLGGEDAGQAGHDDGGVEQAKGSGKEPLHVEGQARDNAQDLSGAHFLGDGPDNAHGQQAEHGLADERQEVVHAGPELGHIRQAHGALDGGDGLYFGGVRLGQVNQNKAYSGHAVGDGADIFLAPDVLQQRLHIGLVICYGIVILRF